MEITQPAGHFPGAWHAYTLCPEDQPIRSAFRPLQKFLGKSVMF